MTSDTTECPACGHDSERCYRCEECGRDLCGDEETTDGVGRR